MSADLIPIRWENPPEVVSRPPISFVMRPGDPAPSGVSVIEGEWPSVRRSSGRGSADAGPTGMPWIDANGWRVRLAQYQAPDRKIWLDYTPPANPGIAGYRLAIAEASVYGARWIISPDDDLRKGLAAGRAESVSGWKQLSADIQFFEGRREWFAFKPVSVIGIACDFAGDNEFIGTEALNLLTRRHVAWRIIGEKSPLDGLKAVLFIGERTPERLINFARQGGLLVCQRPVEGTGAVIQDHRTFDLRAFGKGQVAAARSPWSDPYALASDVHTVMSRRYDPVRLWNAGSFLTHYVEAPDGRRAVVHLLNYSSREPSHDMTLGLAKTYHSARMITPESETPLKPLPAGQGQGIEIQLPPVRVYAAIEVTT